MSKLAFATLLGSKSLDGALTLDRATISAGRVVALESP